MTATRDRVAGVLLVGVAGLALLVADRAPEGRRDSLARVVESVSETPALSLPYAFGFLDRFTAGFFAPFALLQYPFGVLSDRVGRTGPIVAGSAAYGVGVVVVGGTVAGTFGYPAAFLVAGSCEIALALAAIPAFLRLDTGRSATFAKQGQTE